MILYEGISPMNDASIDTNHLLKHVDYLTQPDPSYLMELSTSLTNDSEDYWQLISGEPKHGLWVSSDLFYGFSRINEFGNVEIMWGGIKMVRNGRYGRLGVPAVNTTTNQSKDGDIGYIDINERVVSFSIGEKGVFVAAGFETQADYMEWLLKQ